MFQRIFIAAEEDYMNREHEMESVIERIIINANGDDDDNDNTSESTVGCYDNDDTQRVGPIVSECE
jgi:hypothetical protein